MDAETLAKDFKGRIAFLGGIDTQQLLTCGSPDEVQAEVDMEIPMQSTPSKKSARK